MAAALTELSIQERQLMANCESIIKDQLAIFYKVGEALATIRDQKLYRETHKTFEAYCQEKWSFTRRHANHLISAFGVAMNLGTTGSQKADLPDGERAARELASLQEPAQQKEAWERAKSKAGDKKPKARQVREAVREVKATAAGYSKDQYAADQWLIEQQKPYQLASKSILTIIQTFDALAKEPRTGAYIRMAWRKVIRPALKVCRAAFAKHLPQHVCRACRQQGCSRCRNTGYLLKKG